MAHLFSHPAFGTLSFSAPPKCGNKWIVSVLLDLGFTLEEYDGWHRPGKDGADLYVTIRRETRSWCLSFFLNMRNKLIGRDYIDDLQARDWSSIETFVAGLDLKSMWAAYQRPGTRTFRTSHLRQDLTALLAQLTSDFIEAKSPINVTPQSATLVGT